MLFNSLQFFVFFAMVYALYLGLTHRWQNRLLLVASYVFYAAWDWRFLSLIWISTLVDYFCGIGIEASSSPRQRKGFLFLSVFVNLAILGFFKYFNFFAVNLTALLTNFGFQVPEQTFRIILPMGISFYTFQTMSYTIDIYYRKIKPTRHFLDFALFVAFFPQLVAGPIERARHLLPQILRPRTVTRSGFYEGCYLIFWGMFQKVFVADNLARFVDPVFAQPGPYQGLDVLMAVYAFAFQIFCDFAGYSNIARGLGKCLGVEIMINFNLPYFAANPREFWQRWHISLSSWLRDYLYIPLGGNRGPAAQTIRNLMITMLLGGLWHGAAWTFVVWGAYHGLLLVGHRLLQNMLSRNPAFRAGSEHRHFRPIKIFVFFHLVCLGWLVFRAQSLHQCGDLLQALFFGWEGVQPGMFLTTLAKLSFLLWILVVVQILQYVKKDLLVMFRFQPLPKSVFYYVCVLLIIIFGVTGGKTFIYFQF